MSEEAPSRVRTRSIKVRPYDMSDPPTSVSTGPNQRHGKRSGTRTPNDKWNYMARSPLSPNNASILTNVENTMSRRNEPARGRSWVLMPSSRFRRMWDTAVILVLVYMVVVMPLEIAFGMNMGWDAGMDYTLDFFFGIDIVLNFFTAVELPTGELVTNLRKIASHYLRSWFFLDTMATFPFYLVSGTDSDTLAIFFKIPRLMRVVRLLRLLKLLRGYRFIGMFDEMEYNPNIHPGLFRSFKVLCIAGGFSHVSACLFYLIADDSSPDAWINRLWRNGLKSDPISQESVAYKYLVSIYWALTVLTTVGFGDITPKSNAEMIWTCIVMVMGTSLFSYMTAIISSMTASGDNSANTFRDKMHSLVTFMNGVQLTPQISEKLRRHLRAVWQQPQELDWKKLLEDAPHELRHEVSCDMFRDLIDYSEFFENVKHFAPFVMRVAEELKPAEFTPGMTIARRGTTVEHWYIIAEGIVNVVSPSSKRIFIQLTDGMTFGDVGLFYTDVWEADIRASTHVYLFCVPRAEMLEILDYAERLPNCVGCRQVLMGLAKERLDQLRNHGWSPDTISPTPSPQLSPKMLPPPSPLMDGGRQRRASFKRSRASLPRGSSSPPLMGETGAESSPLFDPASSGVHVRARRQSLRENLLIRLNSTATKAGSELEVKQPLLTGNLSEDESSALSPLPTPAQDSSASPPRLFTNRRRPPPLALPEEQQAGEGAPSAATPATPLTTGTPGATSPAATAATASTAAGASSGAPTGGSTSSPSSKLVESLLTKGGSLESRLYSYDNEQLRELSRQLKELIVRLRQPDTPPQVDQAAAPPPEIRKRNLPPLHMAPAAAAPPTDAVLADNKNTSDLGRPVTPDSRFSLAELMF